MVAFKLVKRSIGMISTIILARLLVVSRERRSIRSAFQEAAEMFPRFRDVVEYRYKLSVIALVAFCFQQLVFLVIGSLFRRWYIAMRLTAFRLSTGAYISLVYLRT